MSLFFPDSTSYSQLQLLPVATGEEQGHVAVDDQPVIAISNLPVAIPDASRHPLPYQFPAIATHLQAVAEVLCLVVLTHESQECHVNWSHSQEEGLEVKTEVFPKAIEDSEHPCSIFNFMWIGFDITVVKCAPIMCIHLVIIFQVRHEQWYVVCDRTL